MTHKISLNFILMLFMLSISPLGAINAKAEKNEGYTVVSDGRRAAIIKSIEESLHKINTLKADFVQERHIALFYDVLRSKGVLAFERPDKLRWELKEPYRTLMLFNKNDVSKFRVADGKIKKANFGMEDVLRGTLGQIISILKGDFGKSMEAYNFAVLFLWRF